MFGGLFTEMEHINLTNLEREKEFQDFKITYPIIGLRPSITDGSMEIEYKETETSEIQYFGQSSSNIDNLPDALKEIATRVWNGLPPIDIEPEPGPTPLTAQQKLAAAGLTVEELKELLGL